VRAAILTAVLIGCAAQPEVAFRGGPLPGWWHRVSSKSDLAYRSEHGATIYANVECKKVDDAPLDVLTNHLLFGVDVHEDQRTEITLAGRKALRTLVAGEVDGVPIRLDAIVLMKDECTYDLALIAGPETFEQHERDFEAFVDGFEVKRCSIEPC
jgi:hypothetical protein